MGRKSLAEKFYKETPETDEDDSDWLMIYDFKHKPNPRFWSNLKRLHVLIGNSSMIQYSVFKTKSKRGAMAAAKLAKHYGAKVTIFKGEEVQME